MEDLVITSKLYMDQEVGITNVRYFLCQEPRERGESWKTIDYIDTEKYSEYCYKNNLNVSRYVKDKLVGDNTKKLDTLYGKDNWRIKYEKL